MVHVAKDSQVKKPEDGFITKFIIGENGDWIENDEKKSSPGEVKFGSELGHRAKEGHVFPGRHDHCTFFRPSGTEGVKMIGVTVDPTKIMITNQEFRVRHEDFKPLVGTYKNSAISYNEYQKKISQGFSLFSNKLTGNTVEVQNEEDFVRCFRDESLIKYIPEIVIDVDEIAPELFVVDWLSDEQKELHEKKLHELAKKPRPQDAEAGKGQSKRVSFVDMMKAKRNSPNSPKSNDVGRA